MLCKWQCMEGEESIAVYMQGQRWEGDGHQIGLGVALLSLCMHCTTCLTSQLLWVVSFDVYIPNYLSIPCNSHRLHTYYQQYMDVVYWLWTFLLNKLQSYVRNIKGTGTVLWLCGLFYLAQPYEILLYFCKFYGIYLIGDF